MSLKRIALWFLIASVGASAALGIVIVLAGSFSSLQIRIMLTTLTISAASICALACGALWESQRNRLLPLAGTILALCSAVLLIVGIWTETQNAGFWKFTLSVSTLAVATAHACLLSLAKLAPRFLWSRIAAFVSIYFLAAFFIYILYFTPHGEGFIRLLGATSIVVAALTIVTPLFHRLSRGDLDAEASSVSGTGQNLHATITCPRCGSAQPNSLTEIKCDNCGCRFLLNILADRLAD